MVDLPDPGRTSSPSLQLRGSSRSFPPGKPLSYRYRHASIFAIVIPSRSFQCASSGLGIIITRATIRSSSPPRVPVVSPSLSLIVCQINSLIHSTDNRFDCLELYRFLSLTNTAIIIIVKRFRYRPSVNLVISQNPSFLLSPVPWRRHHF